MGPLAAVSPLAMLDFNKKGTPESRRNGNTYLPGYGPAGGKGERPGASILTNPSSKQVL